VIESMVRKEERKATERDSAGIYTYQWRLHMTGHMQ